MQSASLTAPTAGQIMKASKAARFGREEFFTLAQGGSPTTLPSVGATIIGAGIELWLKQREIHFEELGPCEDFMFRWNFRALMQEAWDVLIVKKLEISAAACSGEAW